MAYTISAIGTTGISGVFYYSSNGEVVNSDWFDVKLEGTRLVIHEKYANGESWQEWQKIQNEEVKDKYPYNDTLVG